MELRMKRIICTVLLFTVLFSAADWENIRDRKKLGGRIERAAAEPASPQEEAEMKMKIQVGSTAFTAVLENNSSVDAWKELMEDGPLTLHMRHYGNMEKGADLGITLPQNNERMNTQAGDIVLYQGRTLVIYYDTNSWSLTPIGKIDNIKEEELREALGKGDVTVIFSLEE